MRLPLMSILFACTLPSTLFAQIPAGSVAVVPARTSSLVADVPGLTRRFVSVNGTRLHYLDFGGLGDPVVLLAGLGNTAWIWSEFGRQLAREGYRVLALTRRAHGESEAPGRGYVIDTLAADVVVFLDSLAITRAHLIGHSLAGAEITRIASRYPDRVRSLVYVDAAYDRAAQRRYDSIVAPPQLGPGMTDADRASVEAYLAYQRRARLDLARFWGAAVERDWRASLDVDSAGRARWRHPFAPYGTIVGDASRVAPDYRAIRAPALALYATISQAIPPVEATPEQLASIQRFERENHAPWRAESMAQFRAGLQGGRVEQVAGVHHLFLDRPDETLRLIVRFLREGAAKTR